MEKIHVPILQCFDELKFNLGKKTLLDFLKGDPNKTIDKNNLSDLESFGTLFKQEKDQILNIINQLIQQQYLETAIVGAGFQVVKRTPKGTKEIFEKKFKPTKEKIKGFANMKFDFKDAPITSQDEQLFTAFDFFLNKFNQKQKKAIITNNKNVLCIAGAGSGKTTVLTKRVEFLVKFRSTKASSILAITFTKKAKEEMQHRFAELNMEDIKVETFNSFCEKLLKRHGNKLYEQETRVAQYRDKIAIVKNAVAKCGVKFELLIDDYFNKRQLREKSSDELFFIFINDIFTIIDFYKNCKEDIIPFFEQETNYTKKRIAKWMYQIAIEVDKSMKRKGLRDFSDQLVDALKLLKKKPDLMPKYQHILVDEFQDVNKIQVDLLKTLNAKNTFAVGDPRQAIYGWRGSEIKFILDFPKNFKKTEVIQLEKNYRSDKRLVDLFNMSIKSLGLVDLKPSQDFENDKNIFLIEQDNELLERRFVLEAIKNSKSPRNEIFVLARTNKTLEGFATFFKQNGIQFTIKSEEEYRNGEPQTNQIVLATVHSIKGMEAKEVFLVNCNSLSFPNKVQDNFVFALVKNDNDYDKRSEELRLFYVAISRAKEKLIITYTGNFSSFITKKMLELVEFKSKNKSLFEYGSKVKKSKNLDYANSQVIRNALKDWRTQKANALDIPNYMILNNSAIDDLVTIMPESKVQMYNVRGMGEVKIEKYGDELLQIING